MLEISIGALSHRTGLPVSTIRFYDENGLIQSNRNGVAIGDLNVRKFDGSALS
jgi:DNA-binding transcriptional MerR regulator